MQRTGIGFIRMTPIRELGWALVLWGALAIIFGLIAVLWPGLTLSGFAIIFGAFALITGVLEVLHAFQSGLPLEGKWLLALRGAVIGVIGLLALILPSLTVSAFILLIGAFFFVVGISEIMAAFRGHLQGWLVARGALAILLGILIAFWTKVVAYTLTIFFGLFAIAGGVVALSIGIWLVRRVRASP